MSEQIDYSCQKCGAECSSAPDPPERAICPNCCEDHVYYYEPMERRHICTYCGVARSDKMTMSSRLLRKGIIE